MRQRTCGDFHGNVAPPNSNPRSIIKVIAKIERLPNQSIALSPKSTGVFGLWTSRNTASRRRVLPEIGRF
jgi:hypothetical protein